jgi:hypothetical protein
VFGCLEKVCRQLQVCFVPAEFSFKNGGGCPPRDYSRTMVNAFEFGEIFAFGHGKEASLALPTSAASMAKP